MTVRVAAIQCSLGGDYEQNVTKVEGLVREAARRGAQIVLPSELFAGIYWCRHETAEFFAWAEPFEDSKTIERFAKLAGELGIVLPISFFERDGQQYYNSIAIADADGRVLGRYRKSHIPDGPGYEEKFYFRPGADGFKVWKTRFATIGVAICWDQWFPEAARTMALMDAEILFYPTAIGSEPEEPEFDTKDPWQRAMVGHAVCNHMPLVASNRVGDEEGQLFYGSSFICDHRGDKLAELDRKEEGVITADLDLEKIRAERATMGFFRDRRPELYGLISEPR
ncbi:MAG TPA: N-carbamoylputrescine amidase [Polyangiales bacterium]|nr:N-carbamoylputrescine amidase [Polyangiales bacterium]